MAKYHYGDFVFGVHPESDSIFFHRDFLLGMVVEPDHEPLPRILLLCSRFLNTYHPSCTNEDFIEEVKRIRDNPSAYSTSSFTDQYQEFVMMLDTPYAVSRFLPTKEGYAHMLTEMETRNRTLGPSMQRGPFLSFEEFSSRYISFRFESTQPPNLSL